MGIAALVLGLFTSLGLIGTSVSGNPSVDVIGIFFGITNLVGSLLAPWRKAAAVSLLTLGAISLILIGYYTRNVTPLAFGIMYQISAIFAAVHQP